MLSSKKYLVVECRFGQRMSRTQKWTSSIEAFVQMPLTVLLLGE